mgnify:CR=1 FL=1
MADPYRVVRDFEAALCEYTGALFAVAVNSCTMALLLAVAWHLRDEPHCDCGDLSDLAPGVMRKQIEIPRRTYVSVPMSIIHAGGKPVFRDEEWRGAYQLKPLPVWDSARLFTSGMLHPSQKQGDMICVSFHASKTLGDTQGGAILHDDPEADEWLRRARFDGRIEGVTPMEQHLTGRLLDRKVEGFSVIGWHCYLSPDVAARLLLKLYSLPRHNDPLPSDDYPDLSHMDIFR